MKADLGTIGPEATLKARRCVGPKCPSGQHAAGLSGPKTRWATSLFQASQSLSSGLTTPHAPRCNTCVS